MKPVVTETPSAKAVVKLDLAGAFTMPVISPLVAVPPPYRYKDTKVLDIVFKTDPQVLDKLVPAPLKANPDQPLVLYIGHFQFADFDFPYNEAGLLVPVLLDGKPAGLFAVVLYLDKANPTVGGREIYGWPKKDADQILFNEENGKIIAEVMRYGQKIIKVSFEALQKVDPIPERPKSPIYLLKLIPSIQKDAPPDVLKLNSTVIDPDVIKELRVGKATLEFLNSPYDSFLAQIPVKEVVYSEAIVHDFTLGYGQVVIDYLARGQK
jgi:acetoacetate decarboxylase